MALRRFSNRRSFVLIKEGDRVLTSEGRKGKAGVMSGDGLTALVQLDKPYGLFVGYVCYEVRSLVKIAAEKTPAAT
jgi:hypothetical protein